MLFTTDQQTLDDLNIFGRHGSRSVYSIFNQTFTGGGAALLEEMFRYPLSDAAEINRRSNAIRTLAATALTFPFQAGLFDAIDTYLANRDARTQLNAGQSSFSRMLTRDGDTDMLIKGIQAMAGLWTQLYAFIRRLDGEALQPEKNKLLECLQHPAFTPLLQGGTLNNEQLPAFDTLFRFRHYDVVQQLLQQVYLLDVYLSAAKTARERQYCFPAAIQGDDLQVSLKGVYHPHVKHAVPNDITILPGGHVVFLTGANMAGKSTFMKSLSIALFLAHMGFPLPAASMEFTPMEGIYTTINLPDNLGMGASHFYAEVLRIKKMAQELATGRRLFILFDELFRGTNVKDAYEATVTVTGAFATKQRCIFVLSTHIVEAGPVLAAAHPAMRFLYLPTEMKEQQPVYTYRLRSGITDDRHGMVIIRNEGILNMLEAGLHKNS